MLYASTVSLEIAHHRHPISNNNKLSHLTSLSHPQAGLSRHQLSIDISRLKVQRQPAGLRNITPILLRDPMREHVHTRDGAARSPELAVHNPLLLVRPLDIRRDLAPQWDTWMIRRGGLAIKQAHRGRDDATGAGSEDSLELVEPRAHELRVRGRDVLKELGPRAADQEVVESRTVGEGGARQQLRGRRVRPGLERLGHIVELDLEAARRQLVRESEQVLDGANVWCRRRGENVQRPHDVEELEWEDENPELNGRHAVRS